MSPVIKMFTDAQAIIGKFKLAIYYWCRSRHFGQEKLLINVRTVMPRFKRVRGHSGNALNEATDSLQLLKLLVFNFNVDMPVEY
jgi:ribonuclease HI